MNTIDELIEVLQGVKAGRKWGARSGGSNGTLRQLNNQSFESLTGVVSSYRVELMPETITCNGIEIPAPLRVAPVDGAFYCLAAPPNWVFCELLKWDGTPDEREWLRRGLIHTTKEAAAAHGRAMCGVKS